MTERLKRRLLSLGTFLSVCGCAHNVGQPQRTERSSKLELDAHPIGKRPRRAIATTIHPHGARSSYFIAPKLNTCVAASRWIFNTSKESGGEYRLMDYLTKQYIFVADLGKDPQAEQKWKGRIEELGGGKLNY